MDKAEVIFEKHAILGSGLFKNLKAILRSGKKVKTNYIKTKQPDFGKFPNPKSTAPFSRNLQELAYSKKYVKTRPKPPVSVWSSEQKAQGLATEKMFKDLGL